MSAYAELMSYQRDTEALAQILGRLGWDQETMMPKGAAPQRAEEMAALEKVLHARRTDTRMADLLAAAEEETAGEQTKARANLREIRRGYDRATRVPVDLAAELVRLTSLSQGKWAEARAAEDLAAFLPVQGEVLAKRREEAAALAQGGDLYDALLDDYEPGMTASELASMFGEMRPRLVALREAILGSGKQAAVLTGDFDEALQHDIAARCAKAFGYNTDHGRIDTAVHPFSSGSGLDVRITTRTDRSEPLGSVYSTIHEVGHAVYEQSVHPDHLLTAIGDGVSMGVHESQSRIFENQMGRGRAFTGWLFEQMRAAFGDMGVADAEAFYGAVNRVEPGFIRTEADEVHYNLHIMLRFDLERALISGDLDINDLSQAWNDRFEADFGVRPEKPSDGVLQDVHWPVGLFGYFPTYSLGNVYAGNLFEALKSDLPGLDEDLSKGSATEAVAWLTGRLHQYGKLRTPRETIVHALGHEPRVAPLLNYLEAKFGELYDL